MGIILVTCIVLASAVAWQRLNRLQDIELASYAPQAEAALRADGTEGLQHWITNLEHKYRGLRVYAIDLHGKDVLNRELMARGKRIVERMVEHGYLRPEGASACLSGDPLGMTPMIYGANGITYMLIVSYSNFPPLNVLGTLDINLALLTIALGVSGIVSWMLGRSVSRPVARLQSSARSLAAGNLDARVGEESSQRNDELGVLARDFDRMADQLRALIASKETLLRDVSHELRSPLARMRVALGLARRDGAEVGRELDRIEREAVRLDELVGEIITLSQLTTASPNLQMRRVELSGLVSDLVQDAQLEATAQGKRVEWQPDAAGVVEGDMELLRSGIENVLRNAVRFTAPDTAVEVKLTIDARWVMLCVRDHGPGVPGNDLTRIFEPFYRVAEARERRTGGTGLGLAISARVSVLHGGSVQASNAADGGLQVVIRLPRAPDQ